MPWPDADGVLITGVYGSGKSSVAAEITYLLEQRNQPYALLDLDYLGWVGDHAMGYRMMLRNLAGVLEASPRSFNSSRLLEECKTFVRRPDGTTAAANGAHDDTVMAMAIAMAVRAEVVGQASPGRALEVGTL